MARRMISSSDMQELDGIMENITVADDGLGIQVSAQGMSVGNESVTEQDITGFKQAASAQALTIAEILAIYQAA